MTMQTRNWDDWNGESFKDLDTGFRVARDGSLWPWQDASLIFEGASGYEVHVDAEGNPTVDSATGKYRTRVMTQEGHPELNTPPVYKTGQSITAPTGAGGKGGGAGSRGGVYTQAQAIDDALAREKFDYAQQMDDIKAQRQEAQDKIAEALDARNFDAAQHWAGVDRDLRQKEFQLQSDLGYAGSRRADVATNLSRQGQAFNQEHAQRQEIMALAQSPEGYLTSLGVSGLLPSGQNALFDVVGSLGGGWKTPGVERFLNQQSALARPAAQPLADAQPSAGGQPAAAAVPLNATTGMFPAGYAQENPNVDLQLKKWQDDRIAAGQDPNDTEAFRQHLIDIGAPDFGTKRVAGGVTEPLAGARPIAAGAPGSGGSPAEVAAKRAYGAQPLKSFPTQAEIMALPGIGASRLGSAMTPLGTAPGTQYAGGISPFAVTPKGGMRRATAGNISALNPEDALALGQTYRSTGNRALLQDMLRRPGMRGLVR